MAQNYAISEALVVITGLYAAAKLAKDAKFVGAFSVFLFALAAAVGTIKFATGKIAELDQIHSALSQSGGLAGVVLILTQTAPRIGISLVWWQSLAIAGLCVCLGLLMPIAAMIMFITALTASFAILLYAGFKTKSGLLGALGFGIMLPNVVLVRGSAALGPDLAFHAFHILIAIWLLFVDQSLMPQRKPN